VEQGAEVVIGDLLTDDGAALASALGSKAQFVRLDVSREADWIEFFEAAN
jgi:3alpha(or 20beta)-hydroxysteroid dehydrogenase